jgi:hypothetical protein
MRKAILLILLFSLISCTTNTVQVIPVEEPKKQVYKPQPTTIVKKVDQTKFDCVKTEIYFGYITAKDPC